MQAQGKPNIKLTAPSKFFKETIAELKKVTWPTKQETIKLTTVVIAISVIVGIFIGVLDIVFLYISSVFLK